MDHVDAGDRRDSRAAAVAWVVMLLCVVLIFVTQRAFAPDPTDVVVNTVGPDVDQVFSGRVIVGLHELGVGPTSEQLLAEFTAEADRPIDQVRLAVVEAEVAGATPARERLTEVLASVEQQLAVLEQAEADAMQVPAELERALERELGRKAEPGGAIARRLALEAVREDARLLLSIYTADATVELNEATRNTLVARHGWFGRLALTHMPDAADVAAPSRGSRGNRGAVVGEAVRTVVASLGFMAVLGGAGLVGLVLLILGIVFWSDGRLQPQYRPMRRPTAPFLESAALFLVLMIVLSVALPVVGELTGLPVNGLLYALVPLALFWPLARGVNWQRWREGLGWRRGAGVWREVGWGLVGYVAGLPIIFAGLLLTLLVSSMLVEEAEHPITQELFTGGLWQLLLAVGLAVIWAPIVEETIFRGAFYHHMRRRWNALVSGLVVGLVFAAIHPQGVVGIPVLTSVAVVFALIREWRGSLVGPMAAHALHNFGATMLMLLLLR
ncbi:MAG: lysostaphin resistance A-like protein [Phycisphaeraceae bacterium]